MRKLGSQIYSISKTTAVYFDRGGSLNFSASNEQTIALVLFESFTIGTFCIEKMNVQFGN